jgi:hypothetical protein
MQRSPELEEIPGTQRYRWLLEYESSFQTWPYSVSSGSVSFYNHSYHICCPAYLWIMAVFDAGCCGRQRYPMNITIGKGADEQLAQALLIEFLTPIGSEICSI